MYVFDPWAENEPTYSWWKLGVHFTPYYFPKKITDLCPREGGRGGTPPFY